MSWLYRIWQVLHHLCSIITAHDLILTFVRTSTDHSCYIFLCIGSLSRMAIFGTSATAILIWFGTSPLRRTACFRIRVSDTCKQGKYTCWPYIMLTNAHYAQSNIGCRSLAYQYQTSIMNLRQQKSSSYCSRSNGKVRISISPCQNVSMALAYMLIS